MAALSRAAPTHLKLMGCHGCSRDTGAHEDMNTIMSAPDAAYCWSRAPIMSAPDVAYCWSRAPIFITCRPEPTRRNPHWCERAYLLVQEVVCPGHSHAIGVFGVVVPRLLEALIVGLHTWETTARDHRAQGEVRPELVMGAQTRMQGLRILAQLTHPRVRAQRYVECADWGLRCGARGEAGQLWPLAPSRVPAITSQLAHLQQHHALAGALKLPSRPARRPCQKHAPFPASLRCYRLLFHAGPKSNFVSSVDA
jgi:hypothetical protein